MKSAEERKQQSIALLKEQGVPYIEHLPVIENADEVRLRSAEEIARRAICWPVIYKTNRMLRIRGYS